MTLSRADAKRGVTTVGVVTVGVLSDTHGHLYPQVAEALAGVDHIIHAGDVGSPHVLESLKALAPVTAVRGNCDFNSWAQILPRRAELELGGTAISVEHMSRSPRERVSAATDLFKGDFAVVITGHTHLAVVERRGGTLYLNPGSAGPRRFQRPRTIARLVISPALFKDDGPAKEVTAEIVIVPGGE